MSGDSVLRAHTPRVVVVGPLVLALIMGPLDHEPRVGEEQMAPTASLAPGGSANRAIALARLGLDAELVCSIGVDEAGALVRQMLSTQGVDLDHAARIPHQAITASLGFNNDRALTTFGDLSTPPLSTLAQSPHALVAELGVLDANFDTVTQWRRPDPLTQQRTWVLCECRWDASGQWNHHDLRPLDACDLFVLNEAEACNYTRSEAAHAAARQLIWRVPSVVVTRGAAGVLAIIGDEEIILPAAPAKTVDTTAAGHAFSAALVWAHMSGLTPRACVSTAMLAAARSTESVGTFTSAPTLSELQAWTRAREVPEGYDLSFLDLDGSVSDEDDDEDEPYPAPAEDFDPRDDSGFETASDIADSLSN